MSLPVVKIAVVGHTNTGKTSLMRTLMRDQKFGNVSDRPATTRHVEGGTLVVNGQSLIELYDTPGLEDSITLLEYLQSLRPNRSLDGIEIIQEFLTTEESHSRFVQEAKVLRQSIASDLVLYVIDARDRVLGKHRDELEILSYCARPVVPVLNFTAGNDAQTPLWREHLARVNMHVVAEFDTVVIDEHSERRLLEKLRTVLDQFQPTFTALIEERERMRRGLLNVSADVVADLLIDVAAYRITIPVAETNRSEKSIGILKQRVRDREQKCLEQLLSLHQFRDEDCVAADLPIENGQWGLDLFHPAALKQFGIRTGGGAAAGAVAGFSIDAMVGGLSLGAATAIGATMGAIAGIGQMHARRFVNRARGFTELRCDDATIQLLLARQTGLVVALFRRGHASVKPVQVHTFDLSNKKGIKPITVPDILSEVKVHAAWSRLNDPIDPRAMTSNPRQSAQNRLASDIEAAIRSKLDE